MNNTTCCPTRKVKDAEAIAAAEQSGIYHAVRPNGTGRLNAALVFGSVRLRRLPNCRNS
jgi:hypothetical protein